MRSLLVYLVVATVAGYSSGQPGQQRHAPADAQRQVLIGYEESQPVPAGAIDGRGELRVGHDEKSPDVVSMSGDGDPGQVAEAPREDVVPRQATEDVSRGFAGAAPVAPSIILPNLTAFQPAGWSSPIVVSSATGTTTDNTLQAGQPLYVDWSVINNGSASIDVPFNIQIWVDGVLRTWWTTVSALPPNYYVYVTDYSIGALSAGTHTVQIYADSGGAVGEVYENDNVYTKTIFVNGGTPNLTPFQPSGWSGKVVVSNVTGTSTDTTLQAGQTLYVDWAVINNGTAAVPYSFNIQIWVDGVLRTWWTPVAGLSPNYYSYVTDYSIGALSAGTHTITIIADSGGAIAESNENDNTFTRTITVLGSLPNLTPYQPSGWSDRIVVSNVTGTTVDSSSLQPGQTLYIDWAVINNGSAAVPSAFNVQIWVDNVLRATWAPAAGLAPNYYFYVTDYSIGALAAGTHTIKVVADSGGAVGENNESDNTYTKTFIVNALPNLTPFKPSTWSDKIVVSNVLGTTTDAAPLLPGQTLYVDWAVINNGAAATASACNIQLWVDGVLKTWWVPSAGMGVNTYAYVNDYSIGALTSGTHTIKIVADSGSSVAESNEADNQYTKTITVAATLPNLTPYKPGTWSDRIVVAPVTGTTTDGTLQPGQTLYVDWSVINSGAGTASSAFQVQLWVDGVLKTTWSAAAGLQTNFTAQILDYSIGALTAGAHSLKIVADSGSTVAESNEADNTYTKTIQVGAVLPEIRIDPLTLSFAAPAGSAVQTDAPTDAEEAEPRDYRLYLKSGVIDPRIAGRTPDTLSFARAQGGGRHFIVQFHKDLTPGDVAALESESIKVLGYVPNYAYWVAADEVARLARVTAGGGVRAVWKPGTDVKTGALDASHFPQSSRALDGTVAVYVRAFEDVSDQELAAALSARGFPAGEHRFGAVYELRVLPEEVSGLAELDQVEWVEPAPPRYIPYNATAAARIKASDLWNTPYSLSGAGIVVGVWDGGIIASHADFGSRLNIGEAGGSVSSHGTHVGGTIAGSGAGNAQARGGARGATLWSWDWTNDSAEMRAAVPNRGVRISNHSYGIIAGWFWDGGSWVNWGTANFGNYDSTAAEWDDIVRDTGLIIMKAAGNDRGDDPDGPGPLRDGPYDTISTFGNSKNIITVCATTDGDTMTSFSSWGPTNDGRVKPDVCANGDGLLSTVPGGGYGSASGTSMATPSASGGTALLLEQFADLSLPQPKPETVKALLIQGASDLGRTGPDYEHGWGLLNVRASADLIRNRYWRTGSLASSTDKKTYSIDVPAATSSLRVTLAWTDPPASPAAAITLVNDLDLMLTSPTGVVHRPWMLNGAAPSANATRGINHRDNVEQAVVTSPAAGRWTVTVSASALPSGPQAFTVTGPAISDSAANVKNFTIYNDGAGTLNIQSLALAEPGAWIKFLPAAPFAISPGQSRAVSVTVDFALAPAGTTTRRILVGSNDSNENPYPGGVNVTVTKGTGGGTVGFTVTPTAGLRTTEGLGTATFTMKLNAAPTANVTVGLSSTDTTEGTVTPASFTFTPSNWATAQTATVRGVNDTLVDGDVAYTIVTSAASSGDSRYNGLNPANVSVVNVDDERPGFTVSPVSGLRTTEAGGTATFTVRLNVAPTANVTIGLSSTDTTEGTVLPVSLTFSTTNWATPRTVTVRGVNDLLDDGNIAYTIVTSAASSADTRYHGLNPANVSVVNIDND